MARAENLIVKMHAAGEAWMAEMGKVYGKYADCHRYSDILGKKTPKLARLKNEYIRAINAAYPKIEGV